MLTGSIDDGVGLRGVSAGVRKCTPIAAQRVPTGASVLIGLLVPTEVVPRKRTIVAPGLVPDWNMRRDPLLFDHPAKHRGGPVGHISRKAPRLECKAFLDTIDRRSPGAQRLAPCHRCFD